MKIKYDYRIDSENENTTHLKILSQIGFDKKILEIGCSSGYMSEYMKNVLNCRIWGIEIDEAAAAKAAEFCEKMIAGDVESLDLDDVLKGEAFDIIIMADILEHLKDPESLLKKLRSFLADGGFVLISIPNGVHGAISLNALDGNWNYRPMGLMDETHLRFFDKDSFSRLLESSGFFVSVLDRVIVHPRDTELRTSWDSYPREVTAYMEKVNPEFQTYQFVIRAYPATMNGWKLGLEECARFEKERSFKLDEELRTTKAEIEKIHAVYSDEIKRLNAEASQFHEVYGKQISDLNDSGRAQLAEIERLGSINESLMIRSKDLEESLSEVHGNYKMTISSLESELESTRTRYDDYILSLEAERNNLSARVSDLAWELDGIKTSVFWKIITRYRMMIDYLLPQGTKRRRFYQLSVLAPVVLFKEGYRSFFRKVFLRIPLLRNLFDLSSSSLSLKRMVFPVFDAIRVSIVIPVFNKCDYTQRCLVSILENTTGIAYEVIVVDNASSDRTNEMLLSFENVFSVRNDENKGFVEACNIGASRARGEFILFLNNDTEVTPGWLEAMCQPFDDPSTGLVGAKLVYPDGSLQEAGNIIWKDAQGWNYGRGDDPKKPEYCYLKKVDYCSGACLQIRKTLWDDIGGFDMRYAPAYYEDTDLCFEARKRGYDVVYQPEAVVIHYEGVSSGTDINKGYKKYQQINHSKFLEKWKTVLEAHHFQGPEFLFRARDRFKGRMILVADHYVPEFDKDSGSLRMYSLLMILRNMGHKVVFWPENRAYNSKYTAALQKIGVETCYGSLHFDEYMRKNGSFFDYIILSRPHIAEGMIYAARSFSKAKIIYDTVDLHYVREGRRVRQEAEKAESEWKKRELWLANQADYTLVVSGVEKELLEKESVASRISVITNIHSLEKSGHGFEKRSGLMFIGGFMHAPNEDAMIWFVEEIWPKIKKKIGDVHFYIVGSHPPERVRALASSDITVTGFVEDVSPFFEKTRVFVSPLRYGAGVKGKIGQSLSFGLPVVTTHIGAEGMGLVDGTNSLIADDADSFANKVIDLYSDSDLWSRLAEGGRRLIERRFSPDIMKENLEQLII